MTASEPKIHAIFSVSEARDLEGLLREFIEFVTEDLLRVADVTFDPDALAENTLGSLTKFVPPNGRCWVARAEDGTQLGMVFLRRVGRDAMEIKRLYVKPEARGFGLGRNLVTEAIKEAYPDLHLYDPTPIPEALWRVAKGCAAVEKRDNRWIWNNEGIEHLL